MVWSSSPWKAPKSHLASSSQCCRTPSPMPPVNHCSPTPTAMYGYSNDSTVLWRRDTIPEASTPSLSRISLSCFRTAMPCRPHP
ncbi:unnamed protein product [Linum trigynum]|uniref:Uncharacterized protein n=1 Tax=Linum trigynum TaxID=586398 RepID=A0AAV2CAF5_9ROSI